MPQDCGRAAPRAKTVVTAASTALPPDSRTARPARAAAGDSVAITPSVPETGARYFEPRLGPGTKAATAVATRPATRRSASARMRERIGPPLPGRRRHDAGMDVAALTAELARAPSLTGAERPAVEATVRIAAELGLEARVVAEDLAAASADPDWPGAEAPRTELLTAEIVRPGAVGGSPSAAPSTSSASE